MTHKFFKVVSIIISTVFFVYLLIPGPEFPVPPPDATQSQEKADQETPLRRAYFTNFTRQEVVDHYREAFGKSLFNFSLPSIRLNNPPEDAQVLVRDQTRSTFLEEIVHPFRESVYVNGFEPKNAKDDIWYKGVDFRQKIIIKYNPSSVLIRIPIALLTIFAAYYLVKEWIYGQG